MTPRTTIWLDENLSVMKRLPDVGGPVSGLVEVFLPAGVGCDGLLERRVGRYGAISVVEAHRVGGKLCCVVRAKRVGVAGLVNGLREAGEEQEVEKEGAAAAGRTLLDVIKSSHVGSGKMGALTAGNFLVDGGVQAMWIGASSVAKRVVRAKDASGKPVPDETNDIFVYERLFKPGTFGVMFREKRVWIDKKYIVGTWEDVLAKLQSGGEKAWKKFPGMVWKGKEGEWKDVTDEVKKGAAGETNPQPMPKEKETDKPAAGKPSPGPHDFRILYQSNDGKTGEDLYEVYAGDTPLTTGGLLTRDGANKKIQSLLSTVSYKGYLDKNRVFVGSEETEWKDITDEFKTEAKKESVDCMCDLMTLLCDHGLLAEAESSKTDAFRVYFMVGPDVSSTPYYEFREFVLPIEHLVQWEKKPEDKSQTLLGSDVTKLVWTTRAEWALERDGRGADVIDKDALEAALTWWGWQTVEPAKSTRIVADDKTKKAALRWAKSGPYQNDPDEIKRMEDDIRDGKRNKHVDEYMREEMKKALNGLSPKPDMEGIPLKKGTQEGPEVTRKGRRKGRKEKEQADKERAERRRVVGGYKPGIIRRGLRKVRKGLSAAKAKALTVKWAEPINP